MTSGSERGLRERTRLAVRREIALAAEALFLAQGYHATTINDVAEAVKMSPRSLFRYFATKEDIMLEKLDKVVEEMLDALRQRPLDEPIWASLRHMFDVMVDQARAAGSFAAVEPIQRLMLETPAMLARYLQKLHAFQAAVVVILRSRATAEGQPFALNDPTPAARAGAAMACLVTAQQLWLALAGASELGELLDRSMAAVTGAGE